MNKDLALRLARSETAEEIADRIMEIYELLDDALSDRDALQFQVMQQKKMIEVYKEFYDGVCSDMKKYYGGKS